MFVLYKNRFVFFIQTIELWIIIYLIQIFVNCKKSRKGIETNVEIGYIALSKKWRTPKI